ncbi:MAG TPA: very short patch repair endonuclease [Solirubrobacterales bacterium]|nr:very short patch repair endonuclease [Solirubrobacterales bacterium]
MGATRGSVRPLPSSPAVRDQMSRLGQRDTTPELALRSELHRRGLRFRVDHPPVSGVRTRADIVFPREKVAVYVDGCFWHSCPDHGTMPKANADFWGPKLARNQERDREINEALADENWTVVRIWEHEDHLDAADRVERVVLKNRKGDAPG